MSDTVASGGGLRLPAFFSDYMVLQQGIPIPIWGWDEPGQTVSVSFDGAACHTLCDTDGRWRVRLPAHAAGTPFELTVIGSATICLKQVAVGEVWLCSGQSNMEWPVKLSANAAEESANANYPDIRFFSMAKNPSAAPQEDTKGSWQSCTPQSVAAFSAVAYFFGRELQRTLQVPLGLLNAAWGGTGIETWTSREALLAEPIRHEMMATFLKSLHHYEAALSDYHARFRAWQDRHLPSDPGNTGFSQGWADPAIDTAEWPVMQNPCIWQSAGLPFNGIVWFRKEIEIPSAWEGKDLTLSLGVCDDYDTTYFNNVPVGVTGRETPRSWQVQRVYTVPGNSVRPGRSLIAIRILDHLGGGGLTGPVEQMFVSPVGAPNAERIALSGEWAYRVEHNFGIVRAPGGPMPPPAPDNPNAPSALFNGLVAPLISYGLRGVIWYQGEANAPEAWEYRTLFPAMIRDWRTKWGIGDFPFLFVQLANHMAKQDHPADSQWAELREAQRGSLNVPNTAMAVTLDIGDTADVHPKNKQDVGHRLAAAALARVYDHSDIVPSGPLYISCRLEGAAVRIVFTETDGGLIQRGDVLAGFAIAGTDRRFVWANARIDGDEVVVSSPDVPNPVAVRYGWADNPDCSLYNRAGLPASPFRTDDWTLTTQPPA